MTIQSYLYKTSVSIILLILGFLSFTFFTNTADSKDNSDLITLLSLAKDSNMTLEKASLTFGKEILVNQSEKQYDRYKENLERQFDITLTSPAHPNAHRVMEAYGEKKINGNTSLKVKWIAVQSKNSTYNLYLQLQMMPSRLTEEQLVKDYNYLKDLLIQLKITPDINTTLKTAIPSKINHSEQLALINQLFKKVDGSLVEQLNEQDLISMTGYTKQLTRFVKSGGSKINLQVSTHYDAGLNQTIVMIGNPVITLD